MPKFDASRLAGLIDPIYESAALPQLRRGLLAEFSDALGAAGAFLHGDPTAGLTIICSESMDEVLDGGLRTGWLPHRNARMRRELDAFRQGHAIVTESMIFSPWELDHLPFNTEFVTPNKGRSFAAMRLAAEGPSSLVLSVQRYIGSEPFSASEIETMRTLCHTCNGPDNWPCASRRAAREPCSTASPPSIAAPSFSIGEERSCE
jgi:hypothetical protein